MTLDETVAYIKANPIRIPSQLPNPIVTRPIDKDWDNCIKDRYWYHTTTREMFIQENLYDLRTLLLSFGGSEVCLPVKDRDADNILKRGQLWYGDRVYKTLGKPSQCHANSANCWYNNQENIVLCTGYALSEDGMWRQHTWCVEPRVRKSRVIETTVKRVAYFGFAMTKEEALEFYDWNF
jgi:hypothetical protein